MAGLTESLNAGVLNTSNSHSEAFMNKNLKDFWINCRYISWFFMTQFVLHFSMASAFGSKQNFLKFELVIAVSFKTKVAASIQKLVTTPELNQFRAQIDELKSRLQRFFASPCRMKY